MVKSKERTLSKRDTPKFERYQKEHPFPESGDAAAHAAWWKEAGGHFKRQLNWTIASYCEYHWDLASHGKTGELDLF